MIRAMWSAATGMNAQQLMIDVMANNLANVNTAGFKKSRANFEDLFYATYQESGAPTASGGTVPVGIQVGMGTRPISVQKMFTQGDYLETKDDLDMAIEGEGFFLVLSEDQEIYTRDGSFKKDSDGYIVNSRGDRLQPDFSVPQDAASIVIAKNGDITCLSSGGEVIATGQIPIYIFTNPAGLKAVGMNAYVATEASGDPIQGVPGTDNFGTIAQGYLEMSNVDAIEEMINMIVGQRAYELNSKSIKTADTMLGVVTSIAR
ncbi:MAG: Flagellar basal-body rod protein FlgG [Deltaproteobacteria bacterium ADurb.BinA179]|jgi:flagellar basal-body rod protein FlgG|nr:flagellar basal-body rod protein FlgG [Deltaproteobacteria bacterium]MDI9543351.1 flagellar basal-body rod protein FlgG [Pseudomonadota bacterium]OPZ28324.1 MAG: Flagellar basal-body rod protein FlgG [Deltaproteobacteria bacterium ADurb.BinA179]HRR20288.1 flagellar basal-body rod protein FlgG [Desulfomonilia bacterium]HNU76022.1 flagellar basal-body rod protein FlgG [Deltaproteobacteria bacterium]